MDDIECDHQRHKEQPQTTHKNENLKYYFMSEPSMSEDNANDKSEKAPEQERKLEDGCLSNETIAIITPEDSDNENACKSNNTQKEHTDQTSRKVSKEKNNNNECNNTTSNNAMENTGVEVNSAYSSSSTLSTIGKAKVYQFLQTLKRDSVGAVCVAKPGEEICWEEECSGVDVPAEVQYATPPEVDADTSRPSSECNSPSADDEKTTKEKKRVSRRMAPNIHRRSRSGDEVAANLMGRQDWVGMAYHDIPLPGTDDEDSEFAPDVHRNSTKHSRNRRGSSGSMIMRTASAGSTSHQLDDMLNDSLLYSADSKSSFEKFKPDSVWNANQSDQLEGEGLSSVLSWLSARPSSVSPTQSTDKEQQEDVPTSPIISNSSRSMSPRQTPTSPFEEDVLQSIRTFDISKFNPFQSVVADDEADKYATFICPRCKTRQRHFFNINTVQGQFESPAGYFAFYIAIYVIASLFLFGLQEGWSLVDCIYFSVITLTTAGLGDFVPSSDAAKLFCCIFIYFGVACIGLLLGSLLASGMDDKSRQDSEEQRMNCLHCKHEFSSNNQKKSVFKPERKQNFAMSERMDRDHSYEKVNKFKPTLKRIDSSLSLGIDSDISAFDTDILESNAESDYFNYSSADDAQEYDNRRHSINTTKASNKEHLFLLGKVNESTPFIPKPSPARRGRTLSDADVFGGSLRKSHYTADFNAYHSMETSSFELEQAKNFETSSQSTDDYSSYDNNNVLPNFNLKNAKYVFRTVKQAIVNSVFIIFIGSLGFYFIEEWRIIDSFYFTTVLLTTVGYGDIVPKTSGGKLFATIYVLVAGTVLLNNMSTISMIPLELRRRRQEAAVLRQFGDHLDDAALRELASGPLVRRLSLMPIYQNDLEPHFYECTREMFSLAMLVRLGRISEKDIQSTFDAFSRLDVDKDGKLSSKDIICGRVKAHKREKRRNNKTGVNDVKIERQTTDRRYFASTDSGSQNHEYGIGNQKKFTVEVLDIDNRINGNRHDNPNDSRHPKKIPFVPSWNQSSLDSALNGNVNRYNNVNYQMDIESGERRARYNSTNVS